MSLDQTNKEIAVLAHLAEIHKLLLGDSVTAEAVANKLDILPMGSGIRDALLTKRSGNLSYYNEAAANELKPILDRMIELQKAQEFSLAEHRGMSIRTLYLKVYQPWLWLIDKHPDKDKYISLRRDTKISQLKHAVRIVFTAGVLVPKEVNLELAAMNKIQKKISDFLEMPLDSDQMLDLRGLSLSEDDIRIIKDSLAGLPETSVKCMIEHNRIRIMRKFIP